MTELLQIGGWSLAQIALLLEAVAHDRNQVTDPSTLFDLVLSGPDVPGIPTADTAAVTHTLIEEATSEVLLVSYAVHNGQRIFERLAARMQEIPSLRVVLCLDIPRKYTETTPAEEIVHRYAGEFRQKHWPWPQPPELYYDPRSLSEEMEQRSSLHAKCVVVDRRVALVTSANLTEAARRRNIEAGVIVRYQPFVERLAGYFEGLRSTGQLAACRFQE
ncbi:MAG: DISARM system phospholipase D-like protein DrmC [Blastocatellia bacterium]|nr:DISARM system phospholipase D-like protein DrmC [Blastocatellia bacterium]